MRKNYRYITWLSWLAFFALWSVLSAFKLVPYHKLPSPLEVAEAFVDLLRDGYNYLPLARHLFVSFFRLLSSLVLAVLTAIPLGLLCGYIMPLRAIADSFVNFYRNLPPLAYYSLLIIWLGIDETSKITLLYLAAFAPLYIASMSAVSRVKRAYILSAETFGASKRQIFWYVILPATFPEIFVGIRTAVGVCYTTLVSAEMIAATAGIGWVVMDAYKYINTPVVFVGIIIMGLTGLFIDFLLSLCEKKFLFWSKNA